MGKERKRDVNYAKDEWAAFLANDKQTNVVKSKR